MEGKHAKSRTFVTTRSIRRTGRAASRLTPPPAVMREPAAIQLFLFRAESFLGAQVFDASRPVLIGRSSDSELMLQGDTVSRCHARLVLEDGAIHVEDLGSANGTYVNRVRVKGLVPVSPTDALHIGAYTIKLRALRAAMRPQLIDAAETERITRVEAVFSIETDGEREASIDLSSGFDRRLYEDAIRRATGAERPSSPLVAEPSSADTEASKASIASEARAMTERPRKGSLAERSRSKMAELKKDAEMEARLRDLDELIATLDAKERHGDRSKVQLETIDGFLGRDVEAPVPLAWVEPRASSTAIDKKTVEGLREMDTSAFARDLASRLALPGGDTGDVKQDTQPTSRMAEAPSTAVDPLPTAEDLATARPAAAVKAPYSNDDVFEDPDATEQLVPSSPLAKDPVVAAPILAPANDAPTTPSRDAEPTAKQDPSKSTPALAKSEPSAQPAKDPSKPTPVVAKDPSRSTPVAAKQDPSRATPVVAKQEPSRATPVVAKQEPSRATPVVAKQDPSRATPVVAKQEPSRATPVAPSKADASIAPVVAKSEPESVTPVAEPRGVPVIAAARAQAARRATALPSAVPSKATSSSPPPLPRLGTVPRAPLGDDESRSDSETPILLDKPRRVASLAAPVKSAEPRGRSAMIDEPSLPVRRVAPASIAPVSIAPAAPASIAPAARVRHEARLVTQTHMKVGVKPLLAEAQESLDDVWTRAGQVEAQSRPRTVAKKAEPKTIPPPLPAAARAPASAVRSTIDDISHATEQHPRSAEFEAIEISARARGALVDIAVLRNEGEQYVLGHKTPQGRVAPSTVHAGLRMARINADRTVDLVFPKEAAGHLVRGRETVMFSELSEGRKYSCLRLETRDIATLILGEGQHAISYHIRFIRRGAR